MESTKSFKDLAVWKKALSLAKLVYYLSSYLPKEERFCLKDQMRRAAVSISSNIAEGFRRQHHKEFKQFLSISLGSLAELETQIILASELYLLEKPLLNEVFETIDHLSRMLCNLMRRL